MNQKVRQNKFVLLLTILLMATGGVKMEATETKTISISELTALDGANKNWYDNANTEEATWHIYTRGTASCADGKLTLQPNTQLIVVSSAKIFTNLTFSGTVTGTFDKCNNFATADGGKTWTAKEGFTNESMIALTAKTAVTIDGGNITLTTNDPDGDLKTTPEITLQFYDDYADEQDIQPASKYITPAVAIRARVGLSMVDVSNEFTLNYFINGKNPTNIEYDKDKKEVTKDDATGTTIQRLYGGIEVGSKAGTVTINVAVMPKDNTKYNMVNRLFSFNIVPVTPSLTVANSTGLTLIVYKNSNNDNATSQTLKYPAYQLVNTETGQDISSHYNFDYTLEDAGYLTAMYDGSGSSAKAIGLAYALGANTPFSTVTLPESQKAKLRLTVTKKNDDTTYPLPEHAVIDIPITVVKQAEDSRLAVTMTLANWAFNSDSDDEDPHTMHFYRYSNKYGSVYNEAPLSTPVPELKDIYGNPVDEKVKYIYTIDEDVAEKDYCGEDSINHTNTEVHGVWKRSLTTKETTLATPMEGQYQTDWAGYQKLTVYAMQDAVDKYQTKELTLDNTAFGSVTGQFICGADGEPLKETFYVKTHKRVPQLVLTPNPRYMTIGQGVAWNPANRIDVAGYFYDKYTKEETTLKYSNDKKGNSFWYAFEFTPASGIKVTNWPVALEGRVLVVCDDDTYYEASMSTDGTISNIAKDGDTHTYTDADGKTHKVKCYRYYSAKEFGNEDFKVSFTKSGDIKFKYIILPWNHASWDIGEEEITVKVTSQTPVDLVVDPQNVVKTTCQFETETDGEHAGENKVYTERGLGKDFYRLPWDTYKPTMKFLNASTKASTYVNGSGETVEMTDAMFDFSIRVQSRLANGDIVKDDADTGNPGFDYALLDGNINNTIVNLTDEGADGSGKTGILGTGDDAHPGYYIGNGWWQTYAIFDPVTNDLYFSKNDLPASISDVKSVTLTVKATPKSEYSSVFGEAEALFTVYLTHCTNSDAPLYEIINDKTNDDSEAHDSDTHKIDYWRSDAPGKDLQEGKLHFINEGKIYGGSNIVGMPGMDVTLGNFKDIATDGWQVALTEVTDTRNVTDYLYYGHTEDAGNHDETYTVKDSKNYLAYVSGNPVELDENNFPTGGTFYELRPWTNGFLYVDALWDVLTVKDDEDKDVVKPVSYVLINRNKKGEIETDVITATTRANTQQRYRFALLAGTTYYLYAMGGDGVMKVHGLAYQPAFLLARADQDPYTTATAFTSGIDQTTYMESVPLLINTPHANVTFESKNVGKVAVNSSTGDLTLKLASADDDDRTRITGVVKSTKTDLTDKVHKAPWFNLFVSDIPTYVTQDGYKPSVNERITTTNHRTAIEMTYGGWDSNGPYYTEKANYVTVNGTKVQSGVTITDYTDSWKVAKMDSVGKDNRTLDGFKYGSQGGQNGKDENMRANSGNYPGRFGTWKLSAGQLVQNQPEADTYDVPCRGTYLRFEPHEPGRLAVYIMQSGICDYSVVNPEWSDKIAKLTYRPVYIVDETGQPVKLAVTNASNSQGKAFTKHASECYLRSPLHPNVDGESKDFDFSALKTKYVVLRNSTTGNLNMGALTEKVLENMAKGEGQVSDKEYKASDYRLDTYLQAQWASLQTELDAKPSVLEAYETSDGGYITLTKAYMRYAFDVQPGKTYYVFSNQTKLFFDGFAFIPDDWTLATDDTHRDNVENRSEQYNGSKGFSTGKESGYSNTLLYGATPGVKKTLNLDGSAEDTKVTPASAKEALADDTEVGDNIVARKAKAKTAKAPTAGQVVNTDVTLSRTFKTGSWVGLCLPFSISETQFKQVFGEDALIIGYDSLQVSPTGTGEAGDAFFTQHVYHMVEAGRPYFICPGTPDVKENPNYDTETKQFTNPVFKNVTIDWTIRPMTITTPDGNYDFVGTYDEATLHEGDYIIGGKALMRVPKSKENTALTGYRAYLRKRTDHPNPAKIAGFAFNDVDERNTPLEEEEDIITGIEELYDHVITADDIKASDKVYNIQGQQVRHGSTSLDGLQKGIYIINGKKYIVK